MDGMVGGLLGWDDVEVVFEDGTFDVEYARHRVVEVIDVDDRDAVRACSVYRGTVVAMVVVMLRELTLFSKPLPFKLI